VREVAVALLILPDGRIVLQRRTLDAPRSPGKLGLFGGGLEQGEDRDTAAKRELGEETDLSVDTLQFEHKGSFTVAPDPTQKSEEMGVHLYTVAVPHADFAVFEGEKAGAYTSEELRARVDLSTIAKQALHNVFGGAYGSEHN
jgi:8-oxo-dGTP pyrophosphatase MutT (NUDIX family)